MKKSKIQNRQSRDRATPLRVLIVEDQPADAELMLHELRQAGFDPDWQRVEDEADYLARLHANLDVILSDHAMPQFDSSRALHLLQEHDLDIPFLIVTGTTNEEVAVECMKQGAADYLLKDRMARLGPAVVQALDKKRLRDEKRQAEEAAQVEARIAAALARVGQELITSLDVPTILDRLCQITTEVLACDYSYTYLWKPEEDVYVPVAGWGGNPEQWENLRVVRFPRAAVADLRARLERETVVQVKAEHIPGLLPLPAGFFSQYGVSSVVYIALRRGEEIVGVQTASYCGPQECFPPQHERIARGISQLASLALANARLLEQAERANRLKSDFLATMSHELRTPLHIIMGYTDLLLENEFGDLTPGQAGTLQRVDRNSRGLLELITSLLDVSRLEAGRVRVEVEDVSLSELLAEIVGETEDFLRGKPELNFSWQAATELPVRLRTDRMKLKVVLKNLVNNAVKFTEQGGITVNVAARDEGVEFSVADTGIGIAPEVLPEMFDMFRQGEGATTRFYSGVGLGLYIVKRLLNLLRGTVTAESEVGKGSTFRVWLPRDLRL